MNALKMAGVFLLCLIAFLIIAPIDLFFGLSRRQRRRDLEKKRSRRSK